MFLLILSGCILRRAFDKIFVHRVVMNSGLNFPKSVLVVSRTHAKILTDTFQNITHTVYLIGISTKTIRKKLLK